MIKSITPIDGRYYSKISSLSDYYSEFALIRYRLKVEIEYFIALTEIPLPQLNSFDKNLYPKLRNLYKKFTETDAQEIKDIEKITNHDVKAVEYFIKRHFDKIGVNVKFKEFVHFGLTSQDINNTAIPLSLKEGIASAYLPLLDNIINTLKEMSTKWANIPMLAHTHGQPATPTRLGKELDVFVSRLSVQRKSLLNVPYSAKFGGAIGNMNAHHVAYPKIDWNKFSEHFVNDTLNLNRSYPTTQIEHYDNIAALFDAIRRINVILIDLARDIWTYISMEYFKQQVKKGEVGSSAMPHKVNPIDFENAEGNLGMSNAVCTFLSQKLPISRMQRDLTDSTVLRNIGVPIAHSMIAFTSLKKGLDKLILNEDKLNADLENNWAVVAEAIQTILRRESYPNPYEALKNLTRTGGHISKESISEFIDGLDINNKIKEELHKITPQNYIGI
ncbi:MAG: adenylosuccinate lyase [Bacteroidales bacterium]